MNVVVIISADIEWRSICKLHAHVDIFHSPMGEWFLDEIEVFQKRESIRYFHGGWGKISAAASTQYVIDQWRPDLLINLGTCGGIKGQIDNGIVVLVDRTIVYDIIEQMGDNIAATAYYTTDLDLSWLGKDYPMDVIKTSIVSADRDLIVQDIPHLKRLYGAKAGDWESGAIAFVASKNNTPLLILRGVTDLVDESGGEAYGHIELFEQTAHIIMQRLDQSLSGWLEIAGVL